MEKLMSYIRKKSHIEYDMNCIEKYIHGGDHDKNLERVWAEFEEELETIKEEISLLSNPETKEIEIQKLELLDEIKIHETEIKKLNRQVESLKKMMLTGV